MAGKFEESDLASIKVLEQRYGVVSKTIDNWVKVNGFPRPIMLNQRKRVWPVAAILKWERSRATSNVEAA